MPPGWRPDSKPAVYEQAIGSRSICPTRSTSWWPLWPVCGSGPSSFPLAVTDPVARIETILEDCAPAVVITRIPGGGTRARTATSVGARSGGPASPSSDRADDRPAPARCHDRSPGICHLHVGHHRHPEGGADRQPRLRRGRGGHLGGAGSRCRHPNVVRVAVPFRRLVRDALPHALLRRGCRAPAPGGAALPRTFFNAVTREAITYTGFSPSYLRLLLSSPQVDRLAGSTLDVVALGGEACSTADVLALWEVAPGVSVFNRYGPTETTIAVTHARVTPAAIADGTVSIGRPIPGCPSTWSTTKARLVESPGQVGELFIGGNQLMDGYWGAPELTASVLRTDVVPDGTVYRTGDLVYRDGAGLCVRRPRRPGHQAPRYPYLTHRAGRGHAWAGRRVRRCLCGLRRRRSDRHRRPSWSPTVRPRRSSSGEPPVTDSPSRCCPTGSSWSTSCR